MIGFQDVNALAALFDPEHVQGHRQLTDVYRLALAVEHEGRLVTAARTIRIGAGAGASSAHLEILSAAT